MKQTTKTWLTVGAALILAGALGFAGVMSANHWDFSRLSDQNYETSTMEIDESFQNVSIHSDTADIALLPSADGRYRLEFYGPKNAEHTASVQGGTLEIEMNDRGKRFELITFSSPKLSIYLPRTAYASLFIEGGTGDIRLPEDFAFGSIDLSVRTGDVDGHASASGLCRIQTTTGDIHIEGLSAGELALSVSTGKVEARSVVCEGTVDVTVRTGKTVLTDISCGSLVSGGSTGDILLENVLAGDIISVERSTGDVRLKGCDAAELILRTETGDVTGNLLSGKTFLAQSDTGRVDVPETTSGGPCTITVDTGDIIIAIK